MIDSCITFIAYFVIAATLITYFIMYVVEPLIGDGVSTFLFFIGIVTLMFMLYASDNSNKKDFR